MEMSLKTGFAPIFSCCPKNLSCPKFEGLGGGAAAPLVTPARTPMEPHDYRIYYVNYNYIISLEFLSLSRRRSSSRNAPVSGGEKRLFSQAT